MVFQNDILAGASGTDVSYTIDQSIRFNRDDSAYLTRTPSSASNRRTFTLSFWWKMCTIPSTTSGGYRIIQAGSTEFGWSDSNNNLYLLDGGTLFQTSQVFRDPSAWQHIVLAVDTTDATAGNRIKLYINGSEVTNFASGPSVSQNFDFDINDTQAQNIGKEGSNYIGAYVAEFYSVDGTQLDATSFGKTNDDGVWVPKAYAGTYGTNGFYITGSNSASLGEDFSGNNNDFTSSGLTSDDQVTDTPTDNHATLMPIWKSSSLTLSNGNLQQSGDASNRYAPLNIAIPQSGKFYVEFNITTGGGSDASTLGLDSLYRNLSTGEIGDSANGWGYRRYNGTKYHNSVSSSYGSSINTAGVVGIAVDADNGKIWFSEGGTWLNSGDPAAGTGEAFSGIDFSSSTSRHLMGSHASLGTAVAVWNIASTSWTYTPPTGFSALSTANLPAPTITDGSAYFQATTYTGAGYPTEVNQSGNSTFQPDFVWVKRRNGATTHNLFDAVRGVSSQLYSNLTNAEGTVSNAISFDADGFTAAADPITGDTGSNGNTFVGWQWLAANGTASNTNGSITSTVSANTTAGFSVVSYTGNGTAGATVGHGLGVAPSMLICKNRDSTEQWIVYQAGQGATKYGLLNSAAAFASSSGAWNNTEPTSSVVTLGGGGFGTNVSSNGMIMYAFAEVPGFSKFGSYVSNGSTDGPFVWCGFRPAFLLIKDTQNAEYWHIYDSTRDTYNVTEKYLYANLTDAEATSSTKVLDFLSNGFKLRGTDGGINSSSGRTYIFMAFAEHPFGGDGAVPVPAR